MTERVKREVEIYDIYKKKWKKVTGFYPEEWICAYPSCNRVTTTTQRRKAKKGMAHCSSKCRMRHESLMRKREKRVSRPNFIRLPEEMVNA